MTYIPSIANTPETPLTKGLIKAAQDTQGATHIRTTRGEVFPMLGWINHATVPVMTTHGQKNISYKHLESVGGIVE
ncbi:hypothetical protein [Corynebacterium diphtheriae]|uniref:hypothetical protein n=1 Tax=Corynebacterium diphtheriae TaxID=1717 RepID=UPI000A1FFD48|nr:hypothetical protein [Corynebacterium diphtheriae]OSQ14671.1 hypothetical protein B1A57_04075 [Corynebacterium diphtheriae]CAB0543032.1 hypothetical protein CIP107522_00712 [Corynebacterium diphtheriae]